MTDRAAVIAAWRRHGGNIAAAARDLGMTRHKLTRMLGDIHVPRRRGKREPDGRIAVQRPPIFVAEFWLEAWIHDELRRIAASSDMQVRDLIVSILREVAEDERSSGRRG